jgi:2-polyprenyl-3-methyl-5-hydroxy-6-metoxy-1,4-benzoquinol methylase
MTSTRQVPSNSAPSRGPVRTPATTRTGNRRARNSCARTPSGQAPDIATLGPSASIVARSDSSAPPTSLVWLTNRTRLTTDESCNLSSIIQVSHRVLARAERLVLRVAGWRALLLLDDPCCFDRWLWLRGRLLPGSYRTLDAGCGTAVFAIYAALEGNDVVAVTSSAAELEKARRRVGILKVPRLALCQLDLREITNGTHDLGRFDQIICFETIEHILADERTICAFAELLAPRGLLFLTTPSAEHRALYSEPLTPTRIEDGSHVRYGYSRDALRGMLMRAGLVPIEESFVSGVVSQKLTNVMRRIGRVGYPVGWISVLPLRPLVLLDRLLSLATGYPYMSRAVIAQHVDGAPASQDPPAPLLTHVDAAVTGKVV